MTIPPPLPTSMPLPMSMPIARAKPPIGKGKPAKKK
jgi:hypothetical protein